ncbi:MAG: hypothetical protein QG608_3743 [Actinomycetota bacterium]|nr:hypothetical protein [Actinomycetota bacterium]
MDTDWAWVTQSWYPGFCLTFVRDRDPATVADQLGGGPLELMTIEQTGRAVPPSLPGSLLRCGTVPGWTYCYEDRTPIASQPAALARLSAGTQVVQLLKSGDGLNLVQHSRDGQLVEQFEPRPAAESRGAGPPLLLPRVHTILSTQPATSRILAAAQAVGEVVGSVIGPHLLDGPMLTTHSIRAEDVPATPPADASGLGPRLGPIDRLT